MTDDNQDAALDKVFAALHELFLVKLVELGEPAAEAITRTHAARRQDPVRDRITRKHHVLDSARRGERHRVPRRRHSPQGYFRDYTQIRLTGYSESVAPPSTRWPNARDNYVVAPAIDPMA
jgi:hypothetical protein